MGNFYSIMVVLISIIFTVGFIVLDTGLFLSFARNAFHRLVYLGAALMGLAVIISGTVLSFTMLGNMNSSISDSAGESSAISTPVEAETTAETISTDDDSTSESYVGGDTIIDPSNLFANAPVNTAVESTEVEQFYMDYLYIDTESAYYVADSPESGYLVGIVEDQRIIVYMEPYEYGLVAVDDISADYTGLPTPDDMELDGFYDDDPALIAARKGI